MPSGAFSLPLSAELAIELFTPEGERGWVPGWDPDYPDGKASDIPGTIFTTRADGAETLWLIIEIERAARSATYGRITPGRHAGTVRVRCSATGTEACAIEVSYDMTLLAGADPSLLDAYQPSRFDGIMEEWSVLIGDYLSREV